MKSRNCPVCENNNNKEIFIKNNFNIVECQKCSHIFVLNPQGDTSSPFPGNVNINAYKPRHKQILKFLNKYFQNHQKVKTAEIGSGVGHFGNLISKEDKHTYVGYELSKDRYEFTKANGLNVINDFFEESQNTYDVIIMDNVLEHVENPSYLYEIASKSLKLGGVFIVIVPNKNDIRRFIPKWRNRHYWQPCCHINYFSFENLNFLSQKNNMKLYDFDSSTLEKDSSLFLKFKTFLDFIGIHIGGLYTYAIKQ